MAGYKSTTAAVIDEVVDVTAAAIGTVAPGDAQTGIDPLTGDQFYKDGGGLWQAVPVAIVDLNTTVSDQTGGNYAGGAPVAPPAAPDDGDVHVETYDDLIVYWVAVGGAFPVAPAATFSAGIDDVVDTTAAAIGAAAPIGAQLLTDPLTGDQFYTDGGGLIQPVPGKVETPAGVAYPDANANGVPEVGLEDQDGVVLPGFDAATGEWNIPVDRVSDLGGAAPVAPTQEVGMAFAAYDTIALGGTVYVEDTYVWNPATSVYNRVLHPVRDSVIDSDQYDAGVLTAIGAHPATPLCLTDGMLDAAWVTADGSGLTAPVTINIVAGGAAVGTAIVAAGQNPNTPIVATIGAAPITLAANAIGTFTIAGNGTATELVTDIAVTFSFKC